MKDIEVWDMLHGNGCTAKSLSEVIEEMGFPKESFMVINRDGADLRVADGYDPKTGAPQENPYMRFGGNNYKEVQFEVAVNGKTETIQGKMNDFEAIDRQMRAYSFLKGGKVVTGMTGSNNGVFSAMANNGNEFIITKNPEIARQLEIQLGFAKDQLGVPLSNGGMIMDQRQAVKWKMVEMTAKKESLKPENQTQPKMVKSPFRNEYGELNPEYKSYRAEHLGVSGQNAMQQRIVSSMQRQA